MRIISKDSAKTKNGLRKNAKLSDPEGTTNISFAEIVKGRDSAVRVTPDGLIYAVDLVMVVSAKDANNAALDLRRMSEAVFSSRKIVERHLRYTYYHVDN